VRNFPSQGITKPASEPKGFHEIHAIRSASAAANSGRALGNSLARAGRDTQHEWLVTGLGTPDPYVLANEERGYLATLEDRATPLSMGWALSYRLTQALTRLALDRAVARQRPTREHSDRGSQYAVVAYQAYPTLYGMMASMSREGNRSDNAWIASRPLAGDDNRHLIRYTTYMEFEWDTAKNELNMQKHGFDFADAAACFHSPLLVREDTRYDYGEQRWVGLGRIQDVVVNIVFTRRGDRIRVISSRRANHRERQVYFQFLQPGQSD